MKQGITTPACVSQKTGKRSRKAKALKAHEKFGTEKITSFFFVNFTGALELPKTFLGIDFIAIKLHPRSNFFGNKDGEHLNEKDASIRCEGQRDLA